MTTPEQLRAAAGLVRGGWCQGFLVGPNQHVCAVGALAAARFGHRHYGVCAAAAESPALTALARALGAPDSRTSYPENWDYIVRWNNATGQTAENVAATMEYAALLIEQETTAPPVAEHVLSHV